MKFKFLKKIFSGLGMLFKPMLSRIKIAFLEGKLLELIATSSISFVSAVGGIGLVYLYVRTILRKIVVKTSNTVMEEARESKGVVNAITEAVNRDQDVNQDICRYGYTEKDLAKNPEVKAAVDKFNKAKGRISSEALETLRAGKKQKREESKTFQATDDFGNVVFVRRMKPNETREDMSKILADLCRRGWIGGPWSTNQYKSRIKAIYG